MQFSFLVMLVETMMGRSRTMKTERTQQRVRWLTILVSPMIGLSICGQPSVSLPTTANPPTDRSAMPSSDSLSFPVSALNCNQERHFDKVSAMMIAPDGKTLISGGWDRTIKIWDLTTNSLRRTLRGHTAPIKVVTLSPDGQMLASADSDRVIKVWDVSSGRLLKTFKHNGSIAMLAMLAISADRQTLISGTLYDSIQAWNLQTGQVRYTRKLASSQTSIERNILSLSLSPDGKTFFISSVAWNKAEIYASGRKADAILRQWEIETGKEVRQWRNHQHESMVTAAIASPDGRTFLTGDTQGVIRAWDIATNQLIYQVKTAIGGGLSLSVAPDRKTLLVWNSRNLATLDLANFATGKQQLKQINSLHPELPEIVSALIAPDNQHIVTGNETGGITLHSLQTLKAVRSISSGSVKMVSVANHPDGKSLTILLDKVGGTLIWDISQGRQLPLLDFHAAQAIPRYLTPKGDALVTFDDDGTMRWWNLASGTPMRSLTIGLSRRPSTLLTSDQRFLMEWQNDKFVLRDLETGAIAGKFPHSLQYPVAVSPDRQFVVGDTARGTIEIYALPTGKLVRSLPLKVQIRKFLFSADGKRLFGAGVRGLQIWDLAASKVLRIQTPDLIFNDLVLSQDEKTLLSAHADGKMRVWDAMTGNIIRVLEGSDVPVQWLSMASTPNTFLSASVDGTMRLWNWQTAKLLQSSCIVPSPLP